MHSSSAVAYVNNDWRGKLADEFKKLNALHRKLEENPCDLAAIHAYESYKKKREEERQACNIRFCPSQLQSFGNTSLPKEKISIIGQQCLAEFNANKVITFDDLSEEQRQGYEVLKRGTRRSLMHLKRSLRRSMKRTRKNLKRKIYRCSMQRLRRILRIMLLRLNKPNPLLHAAIKLNPLKY